MPGTKGFHGVPGGRCMDMCVWGGGLLFDLFCECCRFGHAWGKGTREGAWVGDFLCMWAGRDRQPRTNLGSAVSSLCVPSMCALSLMPVSFLISGMDLSLIVQPPKETGV